MGWTSSSWSGRRGWGAVALALALALYVYCAMALKELYMRSQRLGRIAAMAVETEKLMSRVEQADHSLAHRLQLLMGAGEH